MVTPLDFCVALCGPSVSFLWKLFWGTLNKQSNLEGITFHLLNKDVTDNVMCDVIRLMGNRGHTPIVYNIQHTYNPTKTDEDYRFRDISETCDYMMGNCGVNKWVCISHFDMWFKMDWVTTARDLINDKVGIIGNHCPIMLVNREAYKKSVLKFGAISGFFAVPINDGSGQYKLRYKGDHRSFGGFPIRGFDIGELLELELRSKGWIVEPLNTFNEESEHLWFHHIGGGGTHYNESEISKKREICDHMIKLFGL